VIQEKYLLLLFIEWVELPLQLWLLIHPLDFLIF